MKMRILLVSILFAGLFLTHLEAQFYQIGDLIAVFDNPDGNNLEINLGLGTQITGATGPIDFGYFAIYLDEAGLSTSSPFSVIGTFNGNSIKGGAPLTFFTSFGTIAAFPQTLIYTQNDGSVPAFLGSASATGTTVFNAINTVGQDEAEYGMNTGTGLSYAIVNASGDPRSYASQIPPADFSSQLQIATAPGTNYLYLLTSQTPGTTGKAGLSEGPYSAGYELGVFSISSTGDLTYSEIPEPSTYAAIIGVTSLLFAFGVAGVSAQRRDA